jgi:hypothetical protein
MAMQEGLGQTLHHLGVDSRLSTWLGLDTSA